MSVDALYRRTLAVFLTLLFLGILTLWVPGFWAVGLFRVAVFSLALGWSLLVAFKSVPVHVALPLWPLAAAVCWPLVQLAAGTTIYRWETWNSLWSWMAVFVCFFLALQLTSSANRLRRFLQAVVWFSFLLSGMSLLQMFTSGGKIFWMFPSGYTDHVLGPFVYQNQYAAFIELTLPVALFFAVFSKTDRMVYSLMSAVMMGSVVASASRAGTLLVVIEGLAVPVAAWRMRLLSGRAAGAVLLKISALLAVAAVVVGAAAVWNRFLLSDPYFLRREVLNSAMQMVRDRPVMGFGLGTWATAYPGYAIFDPGAVINQAHNDWMQWAVEGGLPFFALMLTFAALLLRPAFRSVWGLGVIAVLLHCLVDYPLQQRPALAAFFFAVAGAVAVNKSIANRE